jgi:hypothetical protein
MRGAIHPFPQYGFMAWCSVRKEAQGQLYLNLLKEAIGEYFKVYPSNEWMG